MARIRDPITFSAHFGIPRRRLAALGLLDPVLNLDTKLFIDPMLLATSRHAEMRRAKRTFDRHFESVVRLLSASTAPRDKPWRDAKALLSFHETAATCLGYGSASVRGSGMGAFLSEGLLDTAKEIIDLGITDPDLFLALSLLEDGIGPDRISDMTTTVIMHDLLALNDRVLTRLPVKLSRLRVSGIPVRLPRNPYVPGLPVILVPLDILRDLPIATDWDSVQSAAAHNTQLRARINEEIGRIWYSRSRKDKARLRAAILANKPAFEALLDVLHTTDPAPYDTAADESGLVMWANYIRTPKYPLDLRKWKGRRLTASDVHALVHVMLGHFKELVESKGLWKEFWAGRRQRPEKSAQRFFFAIADAYCKANDLDVTPEADSGGGPVDFKFSVGYRRRVIAEIKLSTNPKVLRSYTKQVDTYRLAEGTDRATYVVILLRANPRLVDRLLSEHNRLLDANQRPSEIFFIDARPRRSASKR